MVYMMRKRQVRFALNPFTGRAIRHVSSLTTGCKTNRIPSRMRICDRIRRLVIPVLAYN